MLDEITLNMRGKPADICNHTDLFVGLTDLCSQVSAAQRKLFVCTTALVLSSGDILRPPTLNSDRVESQCWGIMCERALFWTKICQLMINVL